MINIVNPEVILLNVPKDILERLEEYGRVCYKSESKITEGSSYEFVKGIIRRGHESVLEHISITVKFICDRGISHEIVRHRIASYSQESTRYCNYLKKGISVIRPFTFNQGSPEYAMWEHSMQVSAKTYQLLIQQGVSPQMARSVLPNSLKTEVIMTTNLRIWRYFFRLRCSSAAHPQMKEIALMALHKMDSLIPVVFNDITEEIYGIGNSVGN